MSTEPLLHAPTTPSALLRPHTVVLDALHPLARDGSEHHPWFVGMRWGFGRHERAVVAVGEAVWHGDDAIDALVDRALAAAHCNTVGCCYAWRRDGLGVAVSEEALRRCMRDIHDANTAVARAITGGDVRLAREDAAAVRTARFHGRLACELLRWGVEHSEDE
jgi:hypothetical protein